MRGHWTSHFETKKLRPEMITDKSLASALMAGKSISGWNCLALGLWASCFSVQKEVVFSEQRHLGEKQICQEAELPTTHRLWRHEEKEGIKCYWVQQLPRRV